MPANDFPGGTVWLVGAGPGDPELLTRRAERLLREATIVFYDALVGPAVLDLIPPHVVRVPVGKRSGRHSRDQGTIDQLLVRAASDGERVVRLKGGDPAMFGRLAEEMTALGEAGIVARVCPGITAATAAAAAAGLSLSLRGLARRVQFVTAHAAKGEPLEMPWRELADSQSTLAFYMGRAAAAGIAHGLSNAGLPGATPVLIACDVSLPSERILRTRLDLLPLAVEAISDDKPTIILIGDAVADHGRQLAVKVKAGAIFDDMH
jgi:uroporphyrin-III C-methyltransferase